MNSLKIYVQEPKSRSYSKKNILQKAQPELMFLQSYKYAQIQIFLLDRS